MIAACCRSRHARQHRDDNSYEITSPVLGASVSVLS